MSQSSLSIDQVYPKDSDVSRNFTTNFCSENHTVLSVYASEHAYTKWRESIRVYTRILDAGHEWLRLWLTIRGLDFSGSGRLSFRLADLAAHMGSKPATVYRWLGQGKDHGWRHRSTVDGVITVYYNGIEKIARYLGSSDLGAILMVPTHSLGNRSQCKAISTQADAQLYQRQAYHAACAGQTKLKTKLIKKPWEQVEKNLFSSNPSENPPGGTIKTKKTYAYHGEFYSCPGISIDGLSNRSGWCKNTIQKRLSNSWRRDRDLNFVAKQRSARVISNDGLAYSIHKLGGMVKSIDPKTGKVRVVKAQKMGGSWVAVELGTNIYGESFELISAQRLRSRIKSALKIECMD